ncbi:hypothetical protein SAMN05443244_2170 [Terriglobus roseus]|uniref:Uncharacterized protein n=1 Tax=Terriglobus roseus TaxID=392734 RepID=A0A1H4N8Q1_9BACT|nr:hypothetical protein SAMN05443244_2170 [Terriglobus roseus]
MTSPKPMGRIIFWCLRCGEHFAKIYDRDRSRRNNMGLDAAGPTTLPTCHPERSEAKSKDLQAAHLTTAVGRTATIANAAMHICCAASRMQVLRLHFAALRSAQDDKSVE